MDGWRRKGNDIIPLHPPCGTKAHRRQAGRTPALVPKIEMRYAFMSKAFEETKNEKAIRIAKNMIELNQFPLELIAQVTELPLEKVQELKHTIHKVFI